MNSTEMSPEYRVAVQQASAELKQCADRLITTLINISARGERRTWSERQPAGTIRSFGRDDFVDSCDPAVRRMVRVIDALLATADMLADGK